MGMDVAALFAIQAVAAAGRYGDANIVRPEIDTPRSFRRRAAHNQ